MPKIIPHATYHRKVVQISILCLAFLRTVSGFINKWPLPQIINSKSPKISGAILLVTNPITIKNGSSVSSKKILYPAVTTYLFLKMTKPLSFIKVHLTITLSPIKKEILWNLFYSPSNKKYPNAKPKASFSIATTKIKTLLLLSQVFSRIRNCQRMAPC